MSFIRKIKKAQYRKSDAEPLNESYEGRYIREMNNEIEEGFAKKGEEVGMNEMCNNVIDNIIEGKEITELFNPPSQIKKGMRKQTNKLPKVSNKQSTQSNEDEENRTEHLQNVSSFESNNNSSAQSEEKDKNMQIISNEKESSSNKNNNNNFQNLKYNNKTNEQEYIYPYETMNYKNNNIQFFPGVYLSPQIYPFMPSYNYPSLNKKNFITNHSNNINNKIEGNNSPEKNEQIKLNANIKTQNQYMNPYINNMNNFNKKINQNQMDMKDLPLVINNLQNNNMNYPCQKLNFNMICCPQIQPVNTQIQKHSLDKTNNSSNILPEINNKENTKNTTQEKKTKNNNNNSTNSLHNNVCPIIGKKYY